MSPRKVRLVVDAVRGLSVTAAVTRLEFMKKDAALPVLKLIKSAMANAEHNFHLQKDDLIVKTITADGGPTLKRSHARAFGRAAPIRKRTTHINVILAPKESKGILDTKTVVKTEKAKAAPKKRATKKSADAPAS